MKTSIKTTLAAAALFMAGSTLLQAQTMTGTVLIQPCNNNGQIGVTVTGLTPPISYSYTNWMANQNVVHANINATTDDLQNIAAYQAQWGNANIWSVTASDGTNSASQTFTLTAPFSFADTLNVANCPAQSTLQATFIGGTPPFSCAWTNLTTSVVYPGNGIPVPNGPYSLQVTDGAGCMVSSTTFSNGLNVFTNSNISVNINGTAANCTNGTANASASGGTTPYTYLWSNGATAQNLTGLSQGFFTCIVTDAIGCQSTGYYNVSQGVNINVNTTITNATCLQNNGAVTTFVNGGAAPYSFAWSNGATTQNVSSLAGNQQYIAQVTDANGCTGTGYAYVNATTPIAATYTASPSSCTAATGSATLTASGGTAPYTVIWYTYPSSTSGVSISNQPTGTYSFKITDANGCIRTGAAVIPPSSTINAFLTAPMVVCPATTGNVNLSVTGTNPPFTYAWSNGSTGSALTSVPLGAYSCTITDATGCSVTKYAYLGQSSPVNVGFSITQASCIFAADGAITANATGGTAPYTYTWSNAQTGPSISGLGAGYYYVYVTDANGCTNSYSNIMAVVNYNPANNSCYCTITGTVYADANNDCTQNAGENGIPNIQIHCSGMGYAYTNASGVYSFIAPTGSYTLTESVQQIYPLASCQSNNQVVSVTAAANCTTAVNFANNVVPISDLRIFTTNVNWPVPGNVYTQQIIVSNDGTVNESTAKLGYTHDGQLTYNNNSSWPLAQQNAITYPNWYSVTSGFPSLSPGSSSSTYINYNVPTNIPVNTVVNFNDSIASTAPIATSWLTDNTPWNNVDNHYSPVVSSYDPNFKEVTPQGVGPQGNILPKDSILTYVIHFQNTGSYYAQNIVLVDSLDSDLKISSLKPGYSDHQYTTSISETGVVKFTFKNINLPWKSSYGDVLSSGMVSYSVKLKNNLAVGTQIKNKAAIYFDYNEPVITNTTLNTLSTPVAIKNLKLTNLDQAALFPNPATNFFNLAVKSDINTAGTLKVFDLSGREVSTKQIDLHAGENNLTENTSHLQSGIYLVQLKTPSMQIGKKLIVTK